ncbi:MAG: hypothetical protein QOD84_2902 [Acidobacteriaceae bacterium]|jgi:hypothetical protein
MNRNPIAILACFFLTFPALAQAPAPQPAASAPVSYASMNELNGLLTELEQMSQTTQLDLAKLRIERWKTDSNTKHQTQGNVESIQRNLQTALPDVIAKLRQSPESLGASFQLYRNLDALYDVFGSVVESAGAFGGKEEFQSLDNDLGTLEKSRRSFSDRMENLAGAKDGELNQLRTQLRNAQTVANSGPPKKTVVDDTEPPKKSTRKKAPAKTAKPRATDSTQGSDPAATTPKP